jgi:hypothetical protein
MPEHTAMDNRWQIHVVSQTVAMLLISQEIDRQSQTTLGQYGHETLLSERADETIDPTFRTEATILENFYL